MNIILASQSPRRKELMGLFRLPFCVKCADADETISPGEPPYDAVGRLSCVKARAVEHAPDDVVIGADTVVVCDNQILGKPKTRDDARQMLHLLSGRRHQVMTGVTVLFRDKTITCTEVTDIDFRELTDREIDDYIATGEPMDKAGAYGIQGGAALFVRRLEGDYFNVVGLPVCRLGQILRQITEDCE